MVHPFHSFSLTFYCYLYFVLCINFHELSFHFAQLLPMGAMSGSGYTSIHDYCNDQTDSTSQSQPKFTLLAHTHEPFIPVLASVPFSSTSSSPTPSPPFTNFFLFVVGPSSAMRHLLCETRKILIDVVRRTLTISVEVSCYYCLDRRTKRSHSFQ